MLNLIDRLPQNTHYHHALMHDEEYAEFLAKLKEAGEIDSKAAPRWETWSSEREGLARVEDATRQLGNVMMGAFGGKPGELKPAPRPDSLIAKATAKVKSQSHKKLAARFIEGRKRL